MKYLIFSELNRNHFLFLSYFIITIIKEIDNRYITKTGDLIETFNKYYFYTLSDFFSIIPFIIIKVRSKGISKNKSEQENIGINQTFSKENLEEDLKENNAEQPKNIELIYVDNNIEKEMKRSRRIFKFIIIVSIFDFLAIYSNVTFSIILKNNNFIIKKIKMNSFVLFNIITKYILSILILHSPFHKHHYLALGINLIFLIVLVILDILSIEEKRQYFYILMKIINVIFYSFEDAFAKILLSFDSISPYIYLLYRGICVNILAFIYSIIFIFVKIPDENGKKSCVFTRFWKVYDNKLNILFYIILALFEYLENLNIFLIIDKFSLIHFAVASIMEYFGILLISIIYSEIRISDFFIKLAIYFVLIVSALVYNEFIILNFCGFEKYTQLFLQKEAKKEIKQNFLDNNEDSDSTSHKDFINIEKNSNNENKESNSTGNKSSDIYE